MVFKIFEIIEHIELVIWLICMLQSRICQKLKLDKPFVKKKVCMMSRKFTAIHDLRFGKIIALNDIILFKYEIRNLFLGQKREEYVF